MKNQKIRFWNMSIMTSHTCLPVPRKFRSFKPFSLNQLASVWHLFGVILTYLLWQLESLWHHNSNYSMMNWIEQKEKYGLPFLVFFNRCRYFFSLLLNIECFSHIENVSGILGISPNTVWETLQFSENSWQGHFTSHLVFIFQ